MNREIKFRGKRIDTNEWVQGYYWTNEAGNYFIKVIKDKKNNFVSDPTENDFEINPKTISQYIGLKDKNGKEIYEGDIIEYNNYDGKIYYDTIIFLEFGAAYGGKHLGSFDYQVNECQSIANFDNPDKLNCEVVGNIYENPELLEGK